MIWFGSWQEMHKRTLALKSAHNTYSRSHCTLPPTKQLPALEKTSGKRPKAKVCATGEQPKILCSLLRWLGKMLSKTTDDLMKINVPQSTSTVLENDMTRWISKSRCQLKRKKKVKKKILLPLYMEDFLHSTLHLSRWTEALILRKAGKQLTEQVDVSMSSYYFPKLFLYPLSSGRLYLWIYILLHVLDSYCKIVIHVHN